MASDKPDQPIREKKHRLPPAAYVGEKRVAFTMCVVERARLFRSAETVEAATAILGDQVRRFGCNVPIYCFMPDHIHLIIRGLSKSSRPKAAADAFKCKWSEHLKTNRYSEVMQKDYHDHIIRKHEDWKFHVRYIAANPCRAGFVADWRDWPFTGSIDADLLEVMWGAAD